MAAINCFLKLDGIDGGSTVAKHKGEIDVDTFSWSESQSGSPTAGAGGGAGKVVMQDFRLVMKISKASPKLMLACATGQHIKSAVLSCEKTGARPLVFFKVTMSEVLLSSYHNTGAGNSDILPMDQIALQFGKIEFQFTEQKADGSADVPIRAGFDLKTNKAF